MCGRLKRVRGVAALAAVAALMAVSGCSGSSAPADESADPASAAASATPSGAASSPAADKTVRAAKPGSTHSAGKAAVVTVDGSLLRADIVSKKGDRDRLLGHPEFNDSRMVPTYVTLRITNVGTNSTTRSMAQIMQGFVPEEKNDAEMMQVAPLASFKPCTGKAPPASLKPGEKYTTCRIAVSKRFHPLAKVIYRGMMGDKYYNDPLTWTM